MKKSPERKRSRALPLLLALGVAATVLGTVALLGREAPTPASAVAPAASPATLASEPVRQGHFALRIESTPPGADVREGDRILGTTPIELAVDREAARTTPRSFTLVKEGFAPYPIVQGPSDETVRIIAPLAPLPAATPSPSTAHAGTAPPALHRGAGHSATATPAPAPSASNPDLDIRMTR